MKRIHLVFESVLIAITFFLGINCFFTEDGVLGFAAWMQVLGVSQVAHAILITTHKNARTKKWISVYWLGTLTDLFVLFAIYPVIQTDFLLWFFFPVLPLTLALFLWFITFHLRRHKPVLMTKNQEPLSGFIKE
jgi:O-antigen/teichoic acid export membrane protein